MIFNNEKNAQLGAENKQSLLNAFGNKSSGAPSYLDTQKDLIHTYQKFDHNQVLPPPSTNTGENKESLSDALDAIPATPKTKNSVVPATRPVNIGEDVIASHKQQESPSPKINASTSPSQSASTPEPVDENSPGFIKRNVTNIGSGIASALAGIGAAYFTKDLKTGANTGQAVWNALKNAEGKYNQAVTNEKQIESRARALAWNNRSPYLAKYIAKNERELAGYQTPKEVLLKELAKGGLDVSEASGLTNRVLDSANDKLFKTQPSKKTWTESATELASDAYTATKDTISSIFGGEANAQHVERYINDKDTYNWLTNMLIGMANSTIENPAYIQEKHSKRAGA